MRFLKKDSLIVNSLLVRQYQCERIKHTQHFSRGCRVTINAEFYSNTPFAPIHSYLEPKYNGIGHYRRPDDIVESFSEIPCGGRLSRMSNPDAGTTSLDDVFREITVVHGREFQKYSINNRIYFCPIDDTDSDSNRKSLI
ncbi:hypothetical protein BGW36DRAFT_51608 [Talaromyces proteolyticus]|uniref:Uncharacterized protein n=1 Tax=Talaromyces proteolyticus TaxID=1131652 RepID=A0AAD4PSI2_9EURO|nr:uncharacterized protein BGW36DRAFT_51608 [Talaromyces proteolyticus]KAH8691401.1 hypothetical protein BGW36DRAFT_51608 [Talaromyces proteolyticus]